MSKEMKEGESPGPAHREIERIYRERRSGFLARAERHGADAATAEEVVQDAFGKAIANASALSFIEDMAAWIFAAMRNRPTDLWRGEDDRRRAGLVDLPGDILAKIAEASGVDVHDVRDEIEEALETAIEALPAEQREVLHTPLRFPEHENSPVCTTAFGSHPGIAGHTARIPSGFRTRRTSAKGGARVPGEWWNGWESTAHGFTVTDSKSNRRPSTNTGRKVAKDRKGAADRVPSPSKSDVCRSPQIAFSVSWYSREAVYLLADM